MNAVIATVVFPAHNLEAAIADWTPAFGAEPVFVVPDDFALFKSEMAEIGLTAKPWVNEPLVFFATDDIDAARDALLVRGATPLGEVEDGSLAALGTAPIVNGDPDTGIVDMPGARLAVVRLRCGNLLGLRQATAVD